MVKKAKIPDVRMQKRVNDYLRSLEDVEFFVEIPRQVKAGYCAVCKKARAFTYKGQQFENGKRIFDYYDCLNCGNTQTFNKREVKNV